MPDCVAENLGGNPLSDMTVSGAIPEQRCAGLPEHVHQARRHRLSGRVDDLAGVAAVEPCDRDNAIARDADVSDAHASGVAAAVVHRAATDDQVELPRRRAGATAHADTQQASAAKAHRQHRPTSSHPSPPTRRHYTAPRPV